MDPVLIGKKYDKIAESWDKHHKTSNYGVKQIEKAIKFCINKDKALDIGCGTGGRFIHLLKNNDFRVIGVDVSKEMIGLAKQNHPSEEFNVADICHWKTQDKFDFIMAWDSIFHLPIKMQKPVITKLCDLLSTDGVLVYTFGDAYGEHTNDGFLYSSIGINANIQTLTDNEMTCKHLELDQWPENHAYLIAVKN